MGKLFLLFTIVPLVELTLLGRIAATVGLGTTLVMVIVTGMLGASLARRQGLQVLSEWQRALEQGRVPETGVTDALLIVVGGVLLITPGVLTDALGLALMARGPRRLIGRGLSAYVRRRVDVHPAGFAGTGGPMNGFGGRPGGAPSPQPGGPTGGPGPATPRAGVPDDRDVVHVKARVRDVPADD